MSEDFYDAEAWLTRQLSEARAELDRLREREKELEFVAKEALSMANGGRVQAVFYLKENIRLRAALEWALDLIEMYDRHLIDKGDPPEQVRSATHLDGLARARQALSPTPEEG